MLGAMFGKGRLKLPMLIEVAAPQEMVALGLGHIDRHSIIGPRGGSASCRRGHCRVPNRRTRLGLCGLSGTPAWTAAEYLVVPF